MPITLEKVGSWMERQIRRARKEGEPVPFHFAFRKGLPEWLQIDEWWDTREDLVPLLVEYEVKKLPWSLVGPVQELFQALVFRNYYSAIALARPILETILVDRSAQLRYDPYVVDEAEDRLCLRKLADLIELAARKKPDLRTPMETIRRNSNYVLHPEGGSYLESEEHRREVAREVFGALREVVEDLY